MNTQQNLPVPTPSDPAPLPQRSWWQQVLGWPSTREGWWSVRLAGAFFGFYVLFLALVGARQRGGDAFFANPWLAWTILAAGSAAIAAGVTAGVAVVGKREHSLVMGGTLLLGLFVLVVTIGILVGPPPAPECGVRVEQASVRSGPGYDYPVLAVLPREAKLVPLKQNPDPSGAVDFWLLVTYDTDQRVGSTARLLGATTPGSC